MMECSQKELSMILGLSVRRIRELTQEGLFERSPEGKRYNLAACVRAYVAYKIDQAGGSHAVVDFERIKAQHEAVKKEISELRLRRIKGELHEASDVEAVISDMLIRFRSKLLALPPKLSPQLMGSTDPNEIAKILDGEIREVLLELSEYSPDDYTGGADYEEEDEEPDPADL